MDLHTRRSHLATVDNPEPRLDYIVSLAGALNESSKVEVNYVPDRVILTPASFATYLATLGTIDWQHLEQAAGVILHDLNNELVARWVHVTLSRDHQGEPVHRVVLEDRQPKWDNPGLLSRFAAR